MNFKDRGFYIKLLAIALPIALQNLISSSLNMVDTLMIGRLGEIEIASVGLANQFFFLFVLLLFGINSGVSIFTSQFWGKGDTSNIRKVLSLAIILGGGLSAAFAAGALFFPQLILRIFTNDAEVIKLGASYLRIVSVSYIFTAFSFAFSFTLRSIGNAKLTMFVSTISLLTNTLLNYLFIFGFGNIPSMGVAGAAIATLISRAIEMLLIIFYVYNYQKELAIRRLKDFKHSKTFVIRILNTTIPVILNEGFWALGMTMYSISYARISTEAIAAVQITNTVQSIFMVVSMGLGNACAIMIGNVIGAKEETKAIEYAGRFSVLGTLAGFVIGILMFIASPLIIGFFNISPQVQFNAQRILYIIAFFMAFKFFNTLLIIGILRSGGDTKFSMFLEMGSVWLYGVPMAFIGAHVLKLPIYWVIALVSFEEIIKGIVGIYRVLSKKWVKNVIETM
ncbi:MATE family efflux transporter [Alkaliphilus serpentinus]|uniref:MATE family efflux transporter n=1 Tax=Alkaliphilus serpentinus TaxID=1482731 RepID=A0A833HPG0_9FIRM|nr:MATE family efflux transporter [Alkaliphilus serpentinus]KAB3530706.1 MATE family efflux transporter [Alkaliphilus serpentinus]